MSWENNQFDEPGNVADDPGEVAWLISYWRTVPCVSGCHGDYQLQSRQFDHVVHGATREEALAKFQVYVENRREAGELPGIKNLTLFLSRVDTMVRISDSTGKLING